MMSALLTSFTPSCISTPFSFLLIPYLPCLLRGYFPSFLVSSFLLLYLILSPDVVLPLPITHCVSFLHLCLPFFSFVFFFLQLPLSSFLLRYVFSYLLLCFTFISCVFLSFPLLSFSSFFPFNLLNCTFSLHSFFIIAMVTTTIHHCLSPCFHSQDVARTP